MNCPFEALSQLEDLQECYGIRGCGKLIEKYLRKLNKNVSDTEVALEFFARVDNESDLICRSQNLFDAIEAMIGSLGDALDDIVAIEIKARSLASTMKLVVEDRVRSR